MRSYLVIDDFLDGFEALREYADKADYRDVTNPVDGAVYPGIHYAMPEGVVADVVRSLGFLGFNANVVQLFLRLSVDGAPVHNAVHTDVLTGDWTVLMYMNRPEHCRGGTSILTHVDGMKQNPANEAEAEVWLRDSNTPERWNEEFLCPMKSNRAFIYPAALFHRAEPMGGFGDSPENGRLVMTAFLKNQGV